MYGLKMQPVVTAASSPFSDGICEKNHEIVDLTMEKIMDGDPSIKEYEALDYALYAKNLETNNKGFSSIQIEYGKNAKVPGITNSTLAGLNEFDDNDLIEKHLARINLARNAFRQADNDERIKRALKSRVSSNSNNFFYCGDIVSFKEDISGKVKKKWSGPAKVIGNDGKVLFIKYCNNLR